MSLRRSSSLCMLVVALVGSTAYAAPVTFTIDPSRSEVALTDFVFLGTPYPIDGGGTLLFAFDLQGPDSNVASYQGNIETDLDLSGGTIEFTGSSSIDAIATGDWFPAEWDPVLLTGTSGPADYAFIYIALGVASSFDTVFTDIAFDAVSAGPLALSGGSTKSFDSGLTLNLLDGVLQAGATVEFFLPTVDVTGESVANTAANGTLEDLGGGLVELTLPVYFEVPTTDFAAGTGLLLQGQIVATAIVPEPSTAVLFGGALPLFLAMLWRRRCRREA